MRFFLFSISAIGLLLLPACTSRSNTSEAQVSPTDHAQNSSASPATVAHQSADPVEPAVGEFQAESELLFDPTPEPRLEPAEEEESSADASSAEDVLNSVARVLRGAVEGKADEAEGGSQGSVLGSIGRALSKGFQEAAASDRATEE